MQGFDWQQNSSVGVVQQNFVPLNRGDMFVPSGTVAANLLLARLATPFGFAGRNVHAIPITYLVPNANARVQQSIGMITPNYKG